MDALVAEAKRACDLAQRGIGELKPPHRPVKVGAGNLGRVLGVDDPRLGRFRLCQQAGIERHMSTVPRQ